MSRIIPIVVAVLAITALTVVEGMKSDRWVDTNRSAAYCASLLKTIPASIGEWQGMDQEVTDQVLEVAGAEGFISRSYKNTKTGQVVGVWLIVGHARDTAEHTPDVCYPGSGFEQCQNNTVYSVDLTDEKTASFWTAMFKKSTVAGEQSERVFWTWFKPDLGGSDESASVEWVSPENARFHFGSTKALYKLYFTAPGGSTEAPPEESVCLEFAGSFLSEIEPILEKANGAVPEDFVAPIKTEETT